VPVLFCLLSQGLLANCLGLWRLLASNWRLTVQAGGRWLLWQQLSVLGPRWESSWESEEQLRGGWAKRNSMLGATQSNIQVVSEQKRKEKQTFHQTPVSLVVRLEKNVGSTLGS
jgi:hypothetical protein